MVDKADQEEDEERQVSVESKNSDLRPAGIKKLNLNKLNTDLIVGQGLYKKRTTSAFKHKRSKSENQPREPYVHDMAKQYNGKVEGMGQDRLSRAAVHDYKTVQKLKKKEATGLNAIRKVNVPTYKAPPTIGGSDSLFDRFPVKKRK